MEEPCSSCSTCNWYCTGTPHTPWNASHWEPGCWDGRVEESSRWGHTLGGKLLFAFSLVPVVVSLGSRIVRVDDSYDHNMNWDDDNYVVYCTIVPRTVYLQNLYRYEYCMMGLMVIVIVPINLFLLYCEEIKQ